MIPVKAAFVPLPLPSNAKKTVIAQLIRCVKAMSVFINRQLRVNQIKIAPPIRSAKEVCAFPNHPEVVPLIATAKPMKFACMVFALPLNRCPARAMLNAKAMNAVFTACVLGCVSKIAIVKSAENAYKISACSPAHPAPKMPIVTLEKPVSKDIVD
jgi:hypothetical protein